MDETLDVLVIAPKPSNLPALAWWTEFNQLTAIEGVTLTVVGDSNATRAPVSQALRRQYDAVIWSGHGHKNTLWLADGSRIDGEWLATQAKCGAPRVFVVAACLSAASGDELESLTGELSRAGINSVGMLVSVEDRAALIYSVEFIRALRAGADVGQANRVATRSMEQQCPGAGCGVILVPGLTNGYRAIVDRLARFEGRLDTIETRLDTLIDLMQRPATSRRTRASTAQT